MGGGGGGGDSGAIGSVVVAVGTTGGGGATWLVDGITVAVLKSVGDAGGDGVSWARGLEAKDRAQRASDACCDERKSAPDPSADGREKLATGTAMSVPQQESSREAGWRLRSIAKITRRGKLDGGDEGGSARHPPSFAPR